MNNEDAEYIMCLNYKSSETFGELKLDTLIDLALKWDKQILIDMFTNIVISRGDCCTVAIFAGKVEKAPRAPIINYLISRNDFEDAILLYKSSNITLDEIADICISKHYNISTLASFIRLYLDDFINDESIENVLDKLLIYASQTDDDLAIELVTSLYYKIGHTCDSRCVKIIVESGCVRSLNFLLDNAKSQAEIEEVIDIVIDDSDLKLIISTYEKLQSLSSIFEYMFNNKFDNIRISFAGKEYTVSEYTALLDELQTYYDKYDLRKNGYYSLEALILENSKLVIGDQIEPVVPSDEAEDNEDEQWNTPVETDETGPMISNQDLEIHGPNKTIGSKTPENR